MSNSIDGLPPDAKLVNPTFEDGTVVRSYWQWSGDDGFIYRCPVTTDDERRNFQAANEKMLGMIAAGRRAREWAELPEAEKAKGIALARAKGLR